MGWLMEQWHGYFVVSRVILNLGQANWRALLDLIREIQVNGGHTQYRLVERLSLDGNESIFEARYAVGALSFAKFSQKLADIFDKARLEDISYTKIVQDNTVFANYIYGGQYRFSLGLFGCLDDEQFCTRDESRIVAKQFIANNREKW